MEAVSATNSAETWGAWTGAAEAGLRANKAASNRWVMAFIIAYLERGSPVRGEKQGRNPSTRYLKGEKAALNQR
jgi:hypothetical protein